MYAMHERKGDVARCTEITLFERIKAMSLDEMATFLANIYHDDIIVTADKYICRKCKLEHGGHCPVGDNDECLYENNDKETIKLWLEGRGL